MALTEKQQRFVEAYLIEPIASKAARAAGSTAKRAEQAGHELLTNPEVKAAIDAARAERAAETKIDANWVLTRLAAEATADIADLYDKETCELLPVHDWPMIWRQGLVQGIEVDELFDGAGKDRVKIGQVRKIKLDNRVKRLELIGKHIGVNAFQDVVKHTGLDALADRMERAMKRDA